MRSAPPQAAPIRVVRLGQSSENGAGPIGPTPSSDPVGVLTDPHSDHKRIRLPRGSGGNRSP
ncbi:Uncharacterised protein [Mycobacteroides abscessus subsp. abscessus]|nr:Uncharacterised protein [Mycobacteroides abscessus subsp. abscessus]